MDLSVSKRLLDSSLGDRAVRLAVRSLYIDSFRRPATRAARRVAPLLTGIGRRHGRSARIDKELESFALAMVAAMDRAIGNGAVSMESAQKSATTWSRALAGSDRDPARLAFIEEHGVEPPWVLVVAPTAACNLNCHGCYSGSSGAGPSMAYSDLERLVAEARRLWGIKVVVFTGGEPLLYRSESKGVLDIVESNPDLLFLIFSNGTLVDRSVARRLSSLGNPTVALSVEGLRETTDARRGPGAFNRVVRAMDELQDAGALSGISVTATGNNCEELLSDEFLDFFFVRNSMVYGFIFQYMPEGRDPDPSLMVSCEQRLWMWERAWDVIENRGIVMFDFWNHGTMIGGCAAAGRERGYLYVDWDGNVLPCVFAPYAASNIHELYATGRTLNDAWRSPFLAELRGWQQRHAAGDGSRLCELNDSRLVCACPVRDHYDDFRDIVLKTGAGPVGPSAGPCLSSTSYARQMSDYGRSFAEMSRPVLESQYGSGGR
ncbi:MAG: radical SAM/SPASM domain-containing protein [Candidatus Geothermincolia bacterium]